MKKLFLIATILCAVCAVTACHKSADDSAQKAEATPDTLTMLRSDVAGVVLPLQVSADCTADSLLLDTATVTLTAVLTVDNDLIDSTDVEATPAIRAFYLSMMAEDSVMASVLELARQVPVTLVMRVRPQYEDAPDLNLTIPAKEFHTMVIEPLTLRQRDERKVFNRVKADNRSCPFEIEEGVTISSMTVQDRYVTFRTEIDVEKLDFLVMKENRDSVNHAVVESLRLQLQDSLQRQSLLDISEARLGYRNRYVASDSKDSFDISFTPTDLLTLIRVADSLANIPTQVKKKNK
ncbi:MAG: hypothetical protein NC338_04790 [Firmicutes bacterium]|nr:hypothetical protein [Bacillota bacterium]MCM1401363.1 hypothetical protein [Bacteroides sp.]MCM1477388.1 hypothetical protein [Bacteroides sp.]